MQKASTDAAVTNNATAISTSSAADFEMNFMGVSVFAWEMTRAQSVYVAHNKKNLNRKSKEFHAWVSQNKLPFLNVSANVATQTQSFFVSDLKGRRHSIGGWERIEDA